MMQMSGDVCKDIRLFVASCGPTPLRAVKAEEIIRGKQISDDLLAQAASQASQESRPITDLRASGEYRTKMISVLTERVITEASKKARG